MPLLDWLTPLSSIASSLRTIAALYEAELAARTPPILLVTEKPKESDTSVSYTDEPAPRRSWFGRGVEETAADYDEEEEQRQEHFR